jgi:hypothetical protein
MIKVDSDSDYGQEIILKKGTKLKIYKRSNGYEKAHRLKKEENLKRGRRTKQTLLRI